jgi:hypothetical protein
MLSNIKHIGVVVGTVYVGLAFEKNLKCVSTKYVFSFKRDMIMVQ